MNTTGADPGSSFGQAGWPDEGVALIRRLRWPEDAAALERLDTSYQSDVILRVTFGEDAVSLSEERVAQTLRKRFPLELDRDELDPAQGLALVAEQGGELIAYASAHFEAWNRRAELRHLYVAPQRRGHGLGALLLAQMVAWARETRARGLWLETQDVNPGAVRFYRRQGFRLCGVDATLYDPAGPAAGEVALFYYLSLDGAAAPSSLPEGRI